MRFLAYILGALYFIAPFDLLPDYLGFFGRIDDLFLIVALVYYFRKNIGQYQSFKSSEASQKTNTDSVHLSSNLSREDCCQILEIANSASREEISKQYKKLMSQYHPDKVAHLGPELKKLAQEKTIEIKRAYEKLNES